MGRARPVRVVQGRGARAGLQGRRVGPPREVLLPRGGAGGKAVSSQRSAVSQHLADS